MPSKDTQFKKGQSGNYDGRPRETTSFANDFMSEAKEMVGVTVGGRRKYMSIVRAGIKQLLAKAAAGELPSIKQVLDRLEKLDVRAAQQKPTAELITYSDKDREVIEYVYSSLKQKED